MIAGRGRVLDAAASVAAFPLGGIGTGNVSIGARGDFRHWEITNEPNRGNRLPYTFFAIHARPDDGPPVTRVLEARLRPPFEDDHGHAADLAGLPRLRDARMIGEYPLLGIEFIDETLPVEVSLSAFTPFVPLDADASGIPVAILRYDVRNTRPEPVAVTVVGSMTNPIGHTGRDALHFPTFAGRPHNEYRDRDGMRGLVFSTDLDEHDLRFGTACLVTTDEAVTVTPRWVTDFWRDGVQRFWDDLREDGRLDVEDRETLDDARVEDLGRMRIGSLGIVHRLEPGESRPFEFLLAWHVPNRPRAWQGNVVLDGRHAGEVVRNHYATRYADAWDVARQTIRDLPALEGSTRAFHAALFGGTLQPEVVDAVSANLAAVRSTTCFRLEGGVFAAWEGSFDRSGSCEGTCTHVWNYAQSAAFLFPELERSARRTEFLHETRPDGRMNFRANSVFGNEPWDFHPAVDGQLGSVVRLYREWTFSGDDAFLRELWPAAARALDFAGAHWDGNGDGVPDREQHTTYDIELVGENSLAGSMYLAALRAGAAMADRLGDVACAAHYRAIAERGATALDSLSFNGEYYEQVLDDVDERRYQYGTGCLSDQLIGQWLAHVTGLGYLLPQNHIRSALEAVFRHNFRPDLSTHESVQRTFALGDEAGLLVCSWPRGGRPRLPLVYSDEVWTGIEYQVAAHLIYEGFVDEGLTIVRAVRDRHDGYRRDPWNETECGNHYARSLASWSLLTALGGYRYHAPSRRLSFAPAQHGPFASFFSTGSAWGRVAIDRSGVKLTVDQGRLVLDELSVTIEGQTYLTTPPPLAAGETLHHEFQAQPDHGSDPTT